MNLRISLRAISEIESKKQAAIAERSQELPAFEAAIRKTLELKPHKVTIAPAK